jgi:hypothetical protein
MSDQWQQPFPGGVPGSQGFAGPQDAVPPGFGQPAPGSQGPSYGMMPTGAQMKRRNVVAVWLGLPLITLGIYTLVWYYKIHDEMKRFDPRAQINPAGSLLTYMFGGLLCGIPPLVSFYNTGKRIANAQRAAGLAQTCSPVVGLVLCFVLGLGVLYYQSELNKIVAHYGDVPAGAPVMLVA